MSSKASMKEPLSSSKPTLEAISLGRRSMKNMVFLCRPTKLVKKPKRVKSLLLERSVILCLSSSTAKLLTNCSLKTLGNLRTRTLSKLETALNTLANGTLRLARDMVAECKSGVMAPFTKATGKVTWLMVEVA